MLGLVVENKFSPGFWRSNATEELCNLVNRMQHNNHSLCCIHCDSGKSRRHSDQIQFEQFWLKLINISLFRRFNTFLLSYYLLQALNCYKFDSIQKMNIFQPVSVENTLKLLSQKPQAMMNRESTVVTKQLLFIFTF